MLLDDLKKAKMVAFKEKNADARSVLEAVISKAMLKSVDLKAAGKELSDADVLQIITKLIKELDDEIKMYEGASRTDEVNSRKNQQEFIKKYLPELLSEEKVREIIQSLPDKSIKSVMQHFKQNYQGQVDMKVVSTVAKEFN